MDSDGVSDDDLPNENQVTADSPYIIDRLRTYCADNCPQNSHLIRELAQHYGTPSLGTMWGDLFSRYGQARWNSPGDDSFSPIEHPEKPDPFDKVRENAAAAASVSYQKMSPDDLKQNDLPSTQRHPLEPPS